MQDGKIEKKISEADNLLHEIQRVGPKLSIEVLLQAQRALMGSLERKIYPSPTDRDRSQLEARWTKTVDPDPQLHAK